MRRFGLAFALTACSSLDLEPAAVDLATCRAHTFRATPGDGVTWASNPAGFVGDDGVFKALSAGDVEVTVSRGGERARAGVRAHTAFPGPPVVAIPYATAVPRPAVVAAGGRVYAIAARGDSVTLAASTNGGAAFGETSALAVGTPTSIAIDADDLETVYVTVQRDRELDLVVSRDAGRTATAYPLFRGAGLGRATVVSPGAGVVVVAATVRWKEATPNSSKAWEVITFRDAQKGASFPEFVPLPNGFGATASRPTLLAGTSEDLSGGVPVVARRGTVCVASPGLYGYAVDTTCSVDGGQRFAPVPFTANLPSRPTSRSGARVSEPHLAIGEGGALALAWTETNQGYRWSFWAVADHGEFGIPRERAPEKRGPLALDRTGVLWFAGEDGAAEVDKVCDPSAPYSGTLTLGDATSAPTLFETAGGMGVAYLRPEGTGDASLVVVPLAE